MAQRRMFSKDITENDAFLDMPLSTQALYFHLGMQADDDGFVSPNRIVRMLGCQTDDLRILIAKKFVIQFEDGIVVIKHWRINNYLRTDRYKETSHKEKMALLTIKSNGGYKLYNTGIPNDIPQVDAGKDSIGKDTERTRFTRPALPEIQLEVETNGYAVDPERFFTYYESNGWKVGKNPMKNWKAALRNWDKKTEKPLTEYQRWEKAIKNYCKNDTEKKRWIFTPQAQNGKYISLAMVLQELNDGTDVNGNKDKDYEWIKDVDTILANKELLKHMEANPEKIW